MSGKGEADESSSSPSRTPARASPSASPSTRRGSSVSEAEGYISKGKVVIVFHPAGNAPHLKETKLRVGTSTPFSRIFPYLRKLLSIDEKHPLMLSINSTFQPNPDHVIHELFLCFQQGGKLHVNYSFQPAWG